MSDEMKFKPKGVPAGQYLAEFLSIVFKKSDKPGWADSLIWGFLIVGGASDGQTVTRYTGDNPSPKAACGKFWRAVAGEPKVGVETDFNAHVGKRFHILVEDCAGGGGTRVASIVPVNDAEAA